MSTAYFVQTFGEGVGSIVEYIVVFISAALLQFLLHFACTPINGGRKLSRIQAYTVGVSVIAGIATVWFAFHSDYSAIWVLWLVIIASGLGTWGGYAIEKAQDTARRAREAEERERGERELRNDAYDHGEGR